MKPTCEKCYIGILDSGFADTHCDYSDEHLEEAEAGLVSEDKCEFWAHVGLNGLFEQQRKTQQAYERLLFKLSGGMDIVE